MPPLLPFETACKLIWLGVVAIPQWIDRELEQATRDVANSCLPIVVIIAVIAWPRTSWPGTRTRVVTAGAEPPSGRACAAVP